MEVMYPRCAGLDVHAKTVVACVRVATGGTVTYAHQTVATDTRGRERSAFVQTAGLFASCAAM